jgi:hypothetical protein
MISVNNALTWAVGDGGVGLVVVVSFLMPGSVTPALSPPHEIRVTPMTAYAT